MNDFLGARGLIGFLFGFGITLFLFGIRSAPDVSMLTKIAFKKYLNDYLIAQGLIYAIFGASISSLVLGYFSHNVLLSLTGLGIGAYIGHQVFKSRVKTREAESDLRLKLNSGGFLDLVGLAISCGFSLRSGIAQAVAWSNQEVERIWNPLLCDQEANQSLALHLEQISSVNRNNTMGRISRTLLIALERGTPVAQTLRSLSAEIRSETRRELLEISAKKEVAMMVPVVFGILPSVTAIALYPAFVSLSIM